MVNYRKYEEWMGELIRNQKIKFYLEKEAVSLNLKSRKKEFINVILFSIVTGVLISYLENINFFYILSVYVVFICMCILTLFVVISLSCLIPEFYLSAHGIHSEGFSGRKIFITWLEEIIISEEKSDDGDITGYSVAAKSSSSPELYSFFISKKTAESYKFNLMCNSFQLARQTDNYLKTHEIA